MMAHMTLAGLLYPDCLFLLGPAVQAMEDELAELESMTACAVAARVCPCGELRQDLCT